MTTPTTYHTKAQAERARRVNLWLVPLSTLPSVSVQVTPPVKPVKPKRTRIKKGPAK